MDFDKLVRKRASIRKYAFTKKIKEEQIMEILEAGHIAPSPGNLSIVDFIMVNEPEKIDKLADACMQKFLKDAPYLIVVCSNSDKAIKFYDDRAEKYVKQHVGAVIENMLLKITDMGLASCWIGAFSDLIVKNVLNIPPEIEIEAIIPIAYEFEKDATKQREKLSLYRRVFFNEWDNKWAKPYTKVRREDL